MGVNLSVAKIAKQNEDRYVVLGLSNKGSNMELNFCSESIHCKMLGKNYYILCKILANVLYDHSCGHTLFKHPVVTFYFVIVNQRGFLTFDAVGVLCLSETHLVKLRLCPRSVLVPRSSDDLCR